MQRYASVIRLMKGFSDQFRQKDPLDAKTNDDAVALLSTEIDCFVQQ